MRKTQLCSQAAVKEREKITWHGTLFPLLLSEPLWHDGVAASNNQSICWLNGLTKTETWSKTQVEKIILEATGKGSKQQSPAEGGERGRKRK